MSDADRSDPVDALAAELAATAELPVEREAGRWLGEAAAVAGDVAGEDLSAATVQRRVRRVRELLAEVDGTGHPRADERVETALALTAEILDA